VLPLRDAFAAAFFFAFGLSLDPADAGAVLWVAAAAVAVSITLNTAAGLIAGHLHRFGRVAATNVGLTVLARGEFSLILTTLAVGAGLDARLGPFVALYVLALAIIGPLLAARSRLVAGVLPGRLFPATAAAAGHHAASNPDRMEHA
jgi:CPA2 family monovalent cation:H+ antiporter-2